MLLPTSGIDALQALRAERATSNKRVCVPKRLAHRTCGCKGQEHARGRVRLDQCDCDDR